MLKLFAHTKPSEEISPRRWRSRVAAATVVCLSSMLVVGAARAAGDPSQRVKFNDASVWEVDRSRNVLTHLNLPSGLSGSKFRSAKGTVLVEQGVAGLVVVDRTALTIRLLDDVELKLNPEETKVSEGVEVRVGDEKIWVVEPKQGRVFMLDSLALKNTVDFELFSPLTQSEGNLVADLGADDKFHVLIPDTGEVRSFNPDGSERSRVNIGKRSPRSQISAIGASPVVFDPDSRQLFVLGKNKSKPISVDRSDLLLSMPTLFTGYVVASSEDKGGSMVSVSFDGAIDRLVDGLGLSPIRPVVEEDGCAVTASNATGLAGVRCPGSVGDKKTISTSPRKAFQGRLVRGQRWIDDLESNSSAFFRGPREFAKVELRALDEQVTEQSGSNGDAKRTGSAVGTNDNPENEPPKAVDDELRVRPDRVSFLSVLANDLDPNADELSVVAVAGLTGTATALPTQGGTGVAFRPEPGFLGVVTFRVTISDPDGEIDSSMVKVTVTNEGNTAPITRPDKATAAVGSASLIDVTGNDVDPDGDSMTVIDATLSSGAGVVQVSQSAIVSFKPSAPGAAVIRYRVQDERGLASEGTLSIEVKAAENLAPIARNDVFELAIGRTAILNVLLNDLDPDGGQLTLQEFPANVNPLGTLERDGNLIRINPVNQGEQEFTYSVTDGSATSQAKVRVRVKAQVQNRPPIALPDRVNVEVGTFAVANVVANDSDPDGDIVGVTSFTAPTNVEVVSGDGSSLKVRLAAGTTAPAIVVYELSDGSQQVQGTLLVTPILKTVNLAPVAIDDIAGARQGTSRIIRVLSNDADPEGSPLRITKLLQAPSGVRIGTLETQVVVEPQALVGDFSFEYEVADSSGLTDTAWVSVDVISDAKVNRPPLARADRATVRAGFVVSIPATANDEDLDGDDLRIITGGLPAKGTVTVDGGFLRYEANPGSLGTDRFVYVVEDGHGGTAQAEVTVGVLPAPKANRPPIARNDGPIRVPAGESVEIPVLDNDTDPDVDDVISLTRVQPPTSGEATIGRKGLLFIAPTKPGTLKFDYSIADRSSASATATVTVNVVAPTPIGVPPIANPDTTEPVAAGAAVTVDVLANDEDPDGAASALIVVSVTGSGSSVIQSGKAVRLSGTGKAAMYTYVIRDSQGNAVSGTITVPEGSAKTLIARDDADEVASNGTLTIDVLANDSVDPANAPIRITQVGASDGGTAAILNASKITFSPSDGFAGLATFGYTVTDKTGTKANASVRVTVKAGQTVNRPPIVRAGGPVVLLPGETKTLDLKPLVTDPEVGTITYGLGSVPPQVTATLSGSTMSITALENSAVWSGGVPFIATDAGGAKAQNDVLVRVLPPPTTTVASTTIALDTPTLDLTTVQPSQPTIPPTVPPITAPGLVPQTTIFVQPATPPATVPGVTKPPTTVKATLATIPPTVPPTLATTTPEVVTIALTTPPVVTAVTVATTPPTVATTIGSNPTTTVGSEPTIPTTVTTITSTTTSTVAPTTPAPTIVTTTLPPTITITTIAITTTSSTTTLPPQQVPGPPTGVGAGTPTQTSLTVSWSAPGNSGTTAITNYNVRLSTGVIRAAGSSLSLVWTGLVGGTSNSFTVQACNSVGCGSFSASASGTTTTAPTAPGAPTGIGVSGATVSSLTISWSPPANVGSSPITGYEVRGNGGGSQFSATSPFVWTALPEGTLVRFDVRACNAVGCGLYSAESSGTTTVTQRVPGQMSPPAVSSPSTSQLVISWSAPADLGTTAITDYRVRANGNDERSVGLTGTYTWSGLAPGQSVNIDVRACNSVGCSTAFSGQTNGVVQSPPPPARQVVLSAVGTGCGFTKCVGWTLVNFAPGTYPVVCRFRSPDGGLADFAVFNTSKTSIAAQFGCGTNNSPNSIEVIVDGVVSNSTGWI